MNNALIKTQYIDYGINFNDVKNIIDFNTIFKNIDNKQYKILENSIELKKKTNDLFFVKKKFDVFVFDFLINNINHFTENEIKYLTEELETYSQEDIVILFSIELILLLKLYNEKIISLEKLYFNVSKLKYIPIEFVDYLKFQLRDKKTLKKGSFNKNTNILETNKNHYEFPKDYKTLKQYEIKTLLKSIDLPLVELPKNKDNKNVIEFLKNISYLKRNLNLKKFNFSLRIKKVNKDKNGLFIVNTNTIVVDPRYPEAFFHELGHYIYENKLAFNWNDKRHYPSLFKHEINRFKKNNIIELKKHNLEDYSDSSEIFALWFESIIK